MGKFRSIKFDPEKVMELWIYNVPEKLYGYFKKMAENKQNKIVEEARNLIANGVRRKNFSLPQVVFDPNEKTQILKIRNIDKKLSSKFKALAEKENKTISQLFIELMQQTLVVHSKRNQLEWELNLDSPKRPIKIEDFETTKITIRNVPINVYTRFKKKCQKNKISVNRCVVMLISTFIRKMDIPSKRHIPSNTQMTSRTILDVNKNEWKKFKIFAFNQNMKVNDLLLGVIFDYIEPPSPPRSNERLPPRPIR